jgi:hypothetical protein
MKSLDLSQVLKSYEDKPIKNGESGDLTLKSMLLAYLAQAQHADLTSIDKGTVFQIGLSLGPVNGTVNLEQPQYDLIKKLCDSEKLHTALGFPLLWTQQAKNMVDAAETVKE